MGLLILGALAALFALRLAFVNEGDGRDTFTVRSGEFVQEVSLSGKVIAAEEADLGFSQGGRISRIAVDVGDTVLAGQILAEIENGDVRALVLQKQAALEREQATLESLLQGTREEEIAVAHSEVVSAETAYAQSRSALAESVQDAFTTADNAVHNTLDAFIDTPHTDPQLTFIVTDLQLEIRVERARLAMEPIFVQWRSITETLSAESDLRSVVSQTQVNLTTLTTLLTDANAALNKALPTGTVSQSDLDGYKADVAAARSAVNASLISLTSALTAEKSAASVLETKRRNLALKEAGATTHDIAEQRAQVKAAEADLASARAQLAKTLIVAPFSGIVTAVNAEVGESIAAGGNALSMISDESFQIESYVPEINIAALHVGDSATVTLDAYGSETTFMAAIVSIDPAETVRDGVSTYRTLLKFNEEDSRIRAGMTANVTVSVAKRPDALLIPQGLLESRNGKKYVYVLEGDEIREREVSVGGLSSFGDMEILSGLTEGELIVRPPQE